MDDEREVSPPRTPLTWLLIAGNLLVFGAMLDDNGSALMFSPQTIASFGGVDAHAVWNGQIWRLASGMFVHAALWHMGLNLWVLWQVGRLLEGLLGGARFLLVYLTSGMFGFAASLLLQPGLTCGASGAIFGVVGGLLAFATLRQKQKVGRFLWAALFPFVAATLALGVLLPFVDNSAHVGGLVIGFLLSYGLLADETGARLTLLEEAGLLADEEARKLRPRMGNTALGTCLLLFVALLPLSLRPVFSPRYHTLMAHHALERGDLNTAREHAARAERQAPSDGAVRILGARLQVAEARAAGKPPPADVQQAYREGLRAVDSTDVEAAFRTALLDAGGRDPEGMLFRDPVLTRGLCDALLAELGPQGTAEVRNNCAWLLVESKHPAVYDPQRARSLAESALHIARPKGGQSMASDEEYAAFLHTYASALAALGDPTEARAIMERVVAEGLSRNPFYASERRRFDAWIGRTAPRSPASKPIRDAAGAPADAGSSAQDDHASPDGGPVRAR